MKTMSGHCLAPERMGLQGEHMPFQKVFKEGAPESPVLWHVLLDEDVGPLLEEWQRRVGIYLPAFLGDPDGETRRNWGVADGWVDILAYAGDLLLAKGVSHKIVHHSHQEFCAACARSGASGVPRQQGGVRSGSGADVCPVAGMEFLGAQL